MMMSWTRLMLLRGYKPQLQGFGKSLSTWMSDYITSIYLYVFN